MSVSHGRFFDGESGQRLDVGLDINLGAQTLRLSHPDLPMGSQYWPFFAIRALSDQAGSDRLTLSLVADESLDSALITTARLTISDPELIRDLRDLCPDLHKRDVATGTARRVLIAVGSAVTALVLMIFVILPAMSNTLAQMIPIDREIAYGKTIVSQMERLLGGKGIGQLVCTNPKGVAALEKMQARLTADADLDYRLEISVFDHKMINAFAAPGGQIVIMRGLIDKAKSPDEVAAVLAHEIGHVEARDTTRNALRAAGSAGLLSLVLGDFAGGTGVLVVAEYTLNAAYTREAEALADIFALNLMKDAGADAGSLGSFFDQLKDAEKLLPDLPIYMSSHPDTEARAQAARNFAKGQGYVTPVLSETEWAALRGICD